MTGGRGGIRTHGTLAGTPVFKTGALNHSATLPNPEWLSLSVVDGATQREVGALLWFSRLGMDLGDQHVAGARVAHLVQRHAHARKNADRRG